MDAQQKAHDNPTLLLADDSVTIQKVIELTFADQGVRVVAVGDGDQAIAYLEETPPDIVLADVGMPGKSGYEVSRHIKRSPRLKHIPVLLLTGAFEPLDQSRARDAGCDGVLAKPFEPQAVISRVRELLGQPVPDLAAGEPATVRTSPDADALSSPETPAVPPTIATNDDYFEQLDAALSSPPADRGATTAQDGALPQSRAIADTEGDPTVTKETQSATASAAPIPIETPASTAAANSTLADAFAALLAAEERGVSPTETAASWLPASPAATEDLVEQVAQRVLDRLSKQVVRETVADAVSGIAERLVVEEIERIKASVK